MEQQTLTQLLNQSSEQGAILRELLPMVKRVGIDIDMVKTRLDVIDSRMDHIEDDIREIKNYVGIEKVKH